MCLDIAGACTNRPTTVDLIKRPWSALVHTALYKLSFIIIIIIMLKAYAIIYLCFTIVLLCLWLSTMLRWIKMYRPVISCFPLIPCRLLKLPCFMIHNHKLIESHAPNSRRIQRSHGHNFSSSHSLEMNLCTQYPWLTDILRRLKLGKHRSRQRNSSCRLQCS